VLFLVEIALYEFFEIFESHVPRFGFLLTHHVVAFGADAAFDVVFETVVEEGGAAEAAGADGGFFDAEGGELGYFVGY
jgi:hypothetical protein